MLVFELRLVGRKGVKGIEEIETECSVLLSEWDIANLIRIMKTRNQTIYRQINKLYDDAAEFGWKPEGE